MHGEHGDIRTVRARIRSLTDDAEKDRIECRLAAREEAALRVAPAVVFILALAGCGEEITSPAAPAPVNRYMIYSDLVEGDRNLSGPPVINRREADDLATRVCTSSTEGFLDHLTSASALSDRFGGLSTVILDRRMFVIAYCGARLPDFDAAATQACTEAVPVVGRNCPGKFSTLPAR